jgi:pimeloyl-ACP methyl ester carboxylesterase
VLQAITQLNVDNVIITGHSLGGALATLCAFHLSLHFGPSFIHSVYTFAAPEVGYNGFSTLYEKNVSPHYRVNNSKDIVGLLTSQLIQQEREQYLKFLGKEYLLKDSHLLLFRPVGIEKTFTITDGSDNGWGEGDYHNLQKDYIDQGTKYLF